MDIKAENCLVVYDCELLTQKTLAFSEHLIIDRGNLFALQKPLYEFLRNLLVELEVIHESWGWYDLSCTLKDNNVLMPHTVKAQPRTSEHSIINQSSQRLLVVPILEDVSRELLDELQECFNLYASYLGISYFKNNVEIPLSLHTEASNKFVLEFYGSEVKKTGLDADELETELRFISIQFKSNLNRLVRSLNSNYGGFALLPELCTPGGREDLKHENEAIIDGLRRNEFGLIIGPPGCGKSTFALELCSQVATSLKDTTSIFGGYLEVDNEVKGVVHTFFQENNKYQMEERYGHILEKYGVYEQEGNLLTLFDQSKIENFVNNNFKSGISPSSLRRKFIEDQIADTEWRLELARNNLGHEIYSSLILIDPLTQLIDGDENNSVAMNEICEFLSYLARKYDVAVLGIHHTTKSSQSYGFKSLSPNDASGSGVLTRRARWIINLKKHFKNDSIFAKVSKNNNGKEDTRSVRLFKQNTLGEKLKDGDDFAGFGLLDDQEEETLSDQAIEKSLVELIDKHLDRPLTKTDLNNLLKKHSSLTRDQVRYGVENLIEKGAVYSEKKGKALVISKRVVPVSDLESAGKCEESLEN